MALSNYTARLAQLDEDQRAREAREADVLLLDREQRAARDHVRAITAQGHLHSTTACPPFTRALCSHKRVIETMRPEDFD